MAAIAERSEKFAHSADRLLDLRVHGLAVH